MKFIQYKSKRLNGKKAWRFDFTIAGQRIRRGEFPTRREAEEAVAALRSTVRAMRFGLVMEAPSILLSELFEARKKDPQHKNQHGLIPTLNRFLACVGDIRLKDITKSDLKKFVNNCIEKNLGPNTINRYLTSVMACLNSADSYFPELENWTPPRIKHLKQPPSRSRVVSPEEIAKLLTVLTAERRRREHFKSIGVRREIYDLLRLMLLTGAREGELLHLPVSAVNWNWKTVKILATKTGTERLIPLSDLALDILGERRSNNITFFSISYDQLWEWFQLAGKAAGVSIGQKVPGGAVFYDLRHTAASVIEQAGIPYSTVSAILGHKRKDMTSRYTHTTDAKMKEAMEILEKWCREIDGFTLQFGQKPQIKHSALSQKRA